MVFCHGGSRRFEYIPVASVTCGAPSPAGLTERKEHAAPRQDVIGEGEAWEFIQKLNREETDEFVDLTDGIEFRWQRWNLRVSASRLCPTAEASHASVPCGMLRRTRLCSSPPLPTTRSFGLFGLHVLLRWPSAPRTLGGTGRG